MTESLNVLVIDKLPLDCERICALLRLTDLAPSVRSIHGMDEVGKEVAKSTPDIVILGGSGEESQKLEHLHELLFLGVMAPVLVLVPIISPDIRERCLRLGATDVLPKHASSEDIQHAIRYAVARQRVSWRKDLSLMRDELTNLPNNIAFRQYLSTALSNAIKVSEYEVGVMHLGIDGLKLINSGLGRSAGDELLVEASRRLVHCVRDRDVVSRRGGDEFSILVFGPGVKESIDIIARRVLSAFQAPFLISGQEIFCSACLGISLTFGKEGVEDLLQEADIAMAGAKKNGRGNYEVFVRTMQEDALARLKLETDFRHSLSNRDFVLYYQPIVDIENNCIAYCEALVRWKHPKRGLVFPNVFLPLAEETGLVVPMGWQLLHQACRQISIWEEAGHSIAVSVNLSAEQFSSPQLLGQLHFCLEVSGIQSNLLKLEITESSLIENQDHAMTVLNDLKELGLQVYLDDFGTGYSSLAYLERFPLYGLKIDRAFVQGVVDSSRRSSILLKIVELGKLLEMEVVSEGVENQEELQAIRAMSCHLIQGYYFARPSPATEILKFQASLEIENDLDIVVEE